ncbi:hypothetical protein A8B78_07940 [Jannaschia sp. EhC01]|nr:hypothetical protein A8B78_07940 [Jannaschia sp. EhC01]
MELEGLPEGDAPASRDTPLSFTVQGTQVAWPPAGGTVTSPAYLDPHAPLPANTLVLYEHDPDTWDWFAAFDGLPTTSVRCNLRDRSITFTCAEALDTFRVSYHLISPVLPFWCRRDGRLTLHGAVIDIGGEAVIVLGDKGMGKSTICAAFLQKGCAIHSEDVAAISADLASVYRGSNVLRIEADTANAILGDGLRLHQPAFSKPLLKTDRSNAPPGRDSLPIRAILELAPFSDVPCPGLSPVGGHQAKMSILRHLSSKAFPVPTSVKKTEFIAATALAEKIPVLRVDRPRDLAALGDTVDQIIGDHAPRGASHVP